MCQGIDYYSAHCLQGYLLCTHQHKGFETAILFIYVVRYMGGSSSKTTYQQLTDIGINVANSQVQKCTASVSQSQLNQVQGVKGDVIIGKISQKQGAQVDLKCVFSANTQNDIQTKLAQEITQFAQSKGGDITAGFGRSSSEANTNIKNIFKINVNNETVHASVSNIMQTMTNSYKDIGGNLVIEGIDQDQSAQNVAKAMMKSSQYSGALLDISTKIDQGAKSQGGGIFTNMFDMIGGIVGDLKGVILAIALAVAVVVGAGILIYGGKKAYDMMRSGPSGSTSASAPVRMAPAPPAYVPRVPIPPPPL